MLEGWSRAGDRVFGDSYGEKAQDVLFHHPATGPGRLAGQPCHPPARPAIRSLSFDGFATIGAVHSDECEADFAPSAFVPEGAGHDNDWSTKVDSRVGLQLTANFTDRRSDIVHTLYHLGTGMTDRAAIIEACASALAFGAEVHEPPRTTWQGTPAA